MVISPSQVEGYVYQAKSDGSPMDQGPETAPLEIGLSMANLNQQLMVNDG